MAKVIIYHPWVYLKGGAERLIIEYANRSSHEITIATSYFSPETTFQEYSRNDVLIINGLTQVTAKRTFYSLIRAWLGILTAKIPSGFDVILVSSEGFGDFFALLSNAHKKDILNIAYVHTPLKIIYDERTAAKLKNSTTKTNYFIYKLLKPIYMAINKVVWKRYQCVVANSCETKKRIVLGGLRADALINVINPGAEVRLNTRVFDEKSDLSMCKFFLVPGRIMWQKNVEISIRAFALLNDSSVRLIIAGHVDEKSNEYFSRIFNLATSMSCNIEVIKNPNDEMYESLWRFAYGVIFTPECEDWGIVPVEAMAAGKPVIAADQCGPVESVIDGVTGYLVDYTDIGFCDGMKKILSLKQNEYEVMCSEAKNRAELFTWEKFAEQMDQIIDKSLFTQRDK